MIDNINKIEMREDPNPIERRIEMSKNILKDSTFVPQPVELKDIDESFVKWVEDDLDVSYEGHRLPTFPLFSSQRFSEFEQSWDEVDENYNIKLNFKTIARENNPKIGNIYGKASNVPTKKKYLMKSFETVNKNGNKSIIEYRMSQPMAIDVVYKLAIVTNKYELLNKFNTLVNSKFKSIQAYIAPNGHYMSMKRTNISDESEYNADDRIFYSQTYDITVLGYLITENDYEITENPVVKLVCGADGRRTKPIVEIEDGDDEKIKIICTFNPNDKSNVDFTMDCNAKIYGISKQNIRMLNINCEGKNIDIEPTDNVDNTVKPFYFLDEDNVSIKIKRINKDKTAKIIFLAEEKND